ncbi:hypothetical protein GOBAR_DD03101 [Gossypium barbadense]|nr:hypothetical protein GOBAR_DD03101 [Gossypium barbadense]
MDSLCENSLCQEASVDNSSMEDITSKKVHFRDKSDKVGKDMLVDSTAELVLSWKAKLLGQSSKANRSGLEEGEDFDLVEWDIQKTIVNEFNEWNMNFYQWFVSTVDVIDMLRKPTCIRVLILALERKRRHLVLHRLARIWPLTERGRRANHLGHRCWFENKSQYKTRESPHLGTENQEKNIEGSRFRALIDTDTNEKTNSATIKVRNPSNRGKEIVPGNSQEGRSLQRQEIGQASGILGPKDHTLVDRAEGANDNLLVEVAATGMRKHHTHSFGQPSTVNLKGGRNRKNLNKVIQGRGNQFKFSRNSTIPLRD